MLRRLIVLCVAALGVSVLAAPASANHSWGNYHWARTANPFTVPLGDNVSNTAYSNWDSALSLASSDWSLSSVLNAPVVAGGAKGKNCRGVDGTIQVCNASYGFNGWLGLAQIWISGVHIIRGTAKMNDSYFNSPSYSFTNERHVMCQEIGHGFGLDHQDESGADLNTCMDYSNALDNPSPNGHDYDQLATIYNSHLDSSSTVGQSLPDEAAPIATERTDTIRSSTIVEHFGNGFMRVTFIVWALEGPGPS
jgi:hypothetical protein